MSISDRLRAVRLAAAMTQEQVAEKSGMHVTQYNAYERGRSRPADATLKRIATALNVPVHELSATSPRSGTAADHDGTAETAIQKLRAAVNEVAVEIGLDPQRIRINIEA